MAFTGYSIKSICNLAGGKFSGSAPGARIDRLATDSRSISTPGSTLFFAIKTRLNDGHRYIGDAYKKGVRNFVVSSGTDDLPSLNDSNFVYVTDTLTALQALCEHHRQQFHIPVIGITGSNGKTIVKEWLNHLLSGDYKIVRSPKSYNSQIGVPLSVWQMVPDDTLGIFEAGISMPGEMNALQKIIKPTLGIFTNIGEAHSENFSGIRQKTGEKLNLFKDANTFIYCKDHAVIEKEIKTAGLNKNSKIISWSKHFPSDLKIEQITKDIAASKISGTYGNHAVSITIPFIDDASIENAIHCWLLMLFLRFDNTIIRNRMLSLFPVAMRLELKEAVNNCTVINDFYNSDTGSLAVALDFMNLQKQHKYRTVILSDILQSGKNEEALYTEVSQLLAGKKADRLIGIGEAISGQAQQFTGMKASFFKSTDEFLNRFPTSTLSDTTVLLKGARIFEFEKIGRLLQRKAHETVLEINLNAIIHNLNFFRSLLKPQTKIMAMVKAFSYGIGSYEVANILQYHGVHYLAVANADEGVELRHAGITVPIIVMNPEPGSFDLMLQYSLEPEIYGFRILSLLDRFLSGSALTSSTPFSIHIKFDTGMHRLGFMNENMDELILFLKARQYIQVKSLFSHLAASDETEHDDFTRRQIKLFTGQVKLFQKNFSYPVLNHLLNSSGIVRFPEAQFDMVRLGIGLYGVGSDDKTQKNLQQVSRLRSIISQIKTVPAGASVGYGRGGIIRKERKIGIVPVGYADGLSRKLGNGKGKMLVNGKFAPVTGNICMDLCMIDITGIPAGEGDEVIIFGGEFPITVFAKQLETIPYEALTGISRRVKRVYYYE